MRQLFLILTASFFLAASCNKEHLPEYYFKCKVNGQEYVPDNCANCRTADILGDTILILGGNRGFETLGIGINDNGGIKIGNYILNGIIGRRGDYKFSTTPNDRYFTDATHTGQLTITTLDKTNKIIAGTFYYDAYNAIQNKTIKITEGKFRLQYKTN
jgi:hypothetical protein